MYLTSTLNEYSISMIYSYDSLKISYRSCRVKVLSLKYMAIEAQIFLILMQQTTWEVKDSHN